MTSAARSPRPIRSAGVRRLLQEAQELEADDCADYAAQPLEDDIFQWHFTLRGAHGSDYNGGVYHGKLVLPSDYPFKPPEVYMLTPSGRFEVNKKICLSISSFHPETWQPSWGIRTALLAIMAFFETEPKGAVGSLDAPPAERRRLAAASRAHKCATCGFDAADEGSFAALKPEKPRPAKTETEDGSEPAKMGGMLEVIPVEAAGPEVTTAASSESPSPAPSPAPPDSGDELDADSSLTTAASLSSAPPTALFPSAPAPSHPTPRAPRSSSSGRTPRAPRPPVDTLSPPPHAHAHAHAHAGPLVAPGAPRLAPAHLPPRAPAAVAAANALPALPPGVALAQLSADGSAGGGPPSWVDRAVVACVLALVALVVRKVA
ncbi:hypothetical protein JCM10449v2_001624 [Rhodotorula kratochvilovae]